DFRKPCPPRGNFRHPRFGGFLKKQINPTHTGIIALPPGPRANIALSFAAGSRGSDGGSMKNEAPSPASFPIFRCALDFTHL
ncbi:MAG: hypothetical protein MR620_10095, partial [Clostridiales bacterium]|nr:hypothetical protein [Clostridiales bacterium]